MVNTTSNLLQSIRRKGARWTKGILSAAAIAAGIYQIAAPRYAGLGVILTLHRVARREHEILQPGYAISADWLDVLLTKVRKTGWDVVTPNEVVQRIAQPNRASRFVCFTIDDGYADNLEVALPVFRKHGAPFTVYIATGFLDHSVFYWWGGIEELVSRNDEIFVPANGDRPALRLSARTWQEKQAVYDQLDSLCHREGVDVARQLLQAYKIDSQALLSRDALSVAQARQLAHDPLVTIGAHGVTHQRLSLLSRDQALAELREGRRLLEQKLGVDVRHLAYPYGGPDACGTREFELAREVGYLSAVTTRRGNIFAEHDDHVFSLPRRRVPLDVVSLRHTLFGLESAFRHEPVFRTA